MRGIRPDIVANDTMNASARMLLEAKTAALCPSNYGTRFAANGDIAGYRKTPVLDTRTAYHGYFEFLRLETGFELSSSWAALPGYGPNLNRNILDFMK
jgi:hypothetical protein